VALGEAELPRAARVLDAREGRGARAAVVARDLDDVGVRGRVRARAGARAGVRAGVTARVRVWVRAWVRVRVRALTWMTSASALATPEATVPMPTCATSLTLTLAAGLIWWQS